MRLQDKVVLITASTRGIGLACVKACAKEGARVYMAARDLERAKAVAEELGENVKWVYNDATKSETFSSMVEEVVADAGRIDVLVNNFGTSDQQGCGRRVLDRQGSFCPGLYRFPHRGPDGLFHGPQTGLRQ